MNQGVTYVAGRLRDQAGDKNKMNWRILGIFSEFSDAEAACETRNDFVRTFPVNKKVTTDKIDVSSLQFPRRAR
jgi:hypothetical protein